MKKTIILVLLCILTSSVGAKSMAKTYRVYQNPNINYQTDNDYREWLWRQSQVEVAKTNYVNKFIKMQPGELPEDKNKKDIDSAIKDVTEGDTLHE